MAQINEKSLETDYFVVTEQGLKQFIVSYNPGNVYRKKTDEEKKKFRLSNRLNPEWEYFGKVTSEDPEGKSSWIGVEKNKMCEILRKATKEDVEKVLNPEK